MSRFTWTPELSDTARQMRDTGASLRDIGTELGVDKETVRRHLSRLPQAVDQPQDPEPLTLQERVARRNARAFEALTALRDTVARVEAEGVSHLIVGEAKARDIEAELGQHVATLQTIIGGFRELYPDAPTTEPAGHDRDVASH